MKKLALALPLLLATAAVAQTPTLSVVQTPNSTTLTVACPGTGPARMPALVFLGVGEKEGKTEIKFPVPFLAPLVFGIDQAFVLPLGVLDAKGTLVAKIPFGTEGKVIYNFLLQAIVWKWTLDPKAQPPIKTDALPTSIEKAKIGLPR